MTGSRNFFQNRKLIYEIHVRALGRWGLRMVLDDGRQPGVEFTEQDFSRVEDQAITLATSFLRASDVEAVKVVRERVSPNGNSIASEIYRREAPRRFDGPAPKTFTGGLPPIVTIDDLSSRPVAQGLSVILRDFLGQTGVTALECLHHHSLFKRMTANNVLYESLVHQLATKQAEVRKISLKTATQEMNGLFDAALARSHAASQSRLHAELGRLPYGDLHRRLAARASGEDLRFQLLSAIARRLEGSRGPLARLAWVLQACEEGEGGEMMGPLDELLANCLDDPRFVMEMLGGQPSLAAALTELAHFAAGSFIPGRRIEKEVVQLAAVIPTGILPLSRAELWQRIVRTLDSSAPLMRKDPEKEAEVTLSLAAAMKEIVPPDVWPQITVGLSRRADSLEFDA
jgi:hypothetical protein